MSLTLAMFETTRLVRLSGVDLAIIVFYFGLVLVIGFYLKRFAKTGEDFFLAGREMTAWVAGLAFVSANLGSLVSAGRDRHISTASWRHTGIGWARFRPWFFSAS